MTLPAPITIKHVAHEAGVALGTVSNAFNHPDRVRPDTLKHVLDVAARLGYAPNQNARMLAGGRSKFFGLILPGLEHGISLQISNGATAEARKHGYSVLIATANNDDVEALSYRNYFLGTQVAGILMQPPATDGWTPFAPTSGTPTVYLDVQSNDPGYYVAANNTSQGRIMAEHAVSCGARRVAIIGSPSLARLRLRRDGMLIALETHSDAHIELVEQGAWNSAHDGYEIGRQLAERPEETRPDFIIALTDTLATGAISGVRAARLRVPQHIRVAGCDGNPLAWTGPVPLTTIAPPGYEIGRRGIQSLMRQILEGRREANGVPTENHQELVPPFLLARTSTGTDAPMEFADPDIDISGYL